MIQITDEFIVNNDKFISSGFGDEIMLMNLETGDYIGLNSVSADIWMQAEKQITAQHIIEYLLQQYNVEKEVCKAEVLTALEQMLEKGLLLKL
ncbi:MAG: PqqD family protein [Chitinophagaceae bacterium]|nr:PqqD family protein [Chitinophagaceae bacterium]